MIPFTTYCLLICYFCCHLAGRQTSALSHENLKLQPPANRQSTVTTPLASDHRSLHSHNSNNNHLGGSNRPLARPNLMPARHESNSTKQQQDNSNDIPDSAADWLMLGVEDPLNLSEGKNVASFADLGPAMRNQTATKRSGHKRKGANKQASNRTSTSMFDDEQSSTDSSEGEIYDDSESKESPTLAGTVKEPECASQGRYYCTYKEDYPLKLVTEVTKYYKWPLEKLFRDLHAQIMPKLAQDSTGNLVCDSVTRVVRPGWARNTNDRWLVVINTENYHQYVTEVVCQYGPNSRCNFIPPCYYSSCQQRYNTQKLLVIDPTNPYRGPFLSEFLFPSCCVCYVPSSSESFKDTHRSSPSTIYQRTMQQEAASNLYPPQFKPTGLLEDLPLSFIEQAASGISSSSAAMRSLQSSQQGQQAQSSGQLSASGKLASATPASVGHVLAPGEIRRAGEQYKSRHSKGD